MTDTKKTFLSIAAFLILFPALLYIAFWSDKKALVVSGPSRMVAGPNNTLYILIDENIEIVTPEGKKVSSLNLAKDLAVKEALVDFFVEPDGSLILGLADSGKILQYSSEGKLLQTFPIQTATPPKGEPFYFKFTKDPAGYFYLSDSYANSVRLFDSEGREVKEIKGPGHDVNEQGKELIVNKDFAWPNRLLFSGFNLYVIDTNNQRITRFNPDGSFSKAIASWGEQEETVFTRPTDLSVDQANVYVINRKPNGDEGAEIFSLDNKTGARKKFELNSPQLASYFTKNKVLNPEDIIARADAVLVSDQTAMQIFRFSKEGVFLGTFGNELTARVRDRKAFYKWTKISSIICMILLLASLLFIKIRQRKDKRQIVTTATEKPLHFLQRKISRPSGPVILLSFLVVINVLLWINFSHFRMVQLNYIYLPLLGLVVPFIFLGILTFALITIARAISGSAEKSQSKVSPALVIGIVILLAVVIMSGRIINVLPDALTRPLYHIMLSLNMGNYTLYEKLNKIGDVSSVPYLIQALHNEQDNESLRGDMARHPLLDGLNRITGNDPGYKYEDWEVWWKDNKGKTELQWRLAAIEGEGYPVSDYPGAAAIGSIVEAMGFEERVPYGKEYLLNSAGVLLKRCASAEVLSVIENKLQENTSAKFKMGASRALGLLGLSEGIPLLRTLITSDNRNVKNIALLELNKLHQNLISSSPSTYMAHLIDGGENIKYMAASQDRNDNNLFYATRSAVNKMDLKSGKILWSHATLDEPGSELVISKGRILFYCFDGMVYCLDSSTGQFLWKYQTASSRQGYHCNITVLGDLAFMGAEDNLWAFEIATGRVKWMRRNQPSSERLIAHSSDHIILATRQGEFLKISPDGRVIATIKAGTYIQALAADNDFVYVITQDKPIHLKIYSASRLTLLHDEPSGQKDLPAMTLSADTIIVSGQSEISAFNRHSAQLLWSEKTERQQMYSKVEASEKFLAYGDELRVPHTGEIIYKYQVPDIRQSRLIGDSFVTYTADRKIYICRLPPEPGN